MIDLHSHTTASDGQYPPATLVARAAAAGVTVLAVTDHDTVAGLAEAREAAREHGVELVPGIELSAFVHGKEAHILGHFLRPEDAELARFADRLRDERTQRMEAMVARLRELGFPVRMEQVLKVAGDAQLGRPHLARVLVNQGWCIDMKAAFDRFLGTGRAAWVERFKLEGAEAIRLIRNAGGTATLAHPGSSKMERVEIKALAQAGLSGLEVLSADHNPGLRQKYLALAAEFDLVPTFGSDFHGEEVSPDHRLGVAAMPPELFQKLRARAPSASA
ncbi:PHP domain-containing protein [Corallococcus sp. bb12-1]|uniref:PHP domain-containing protein n=1 Tax=Corallococcus sp. bb12-1 TaxID=2996784 RepID=UPI00226DC9F9|nr:PHP domain-containing protein [Corallococcus sp. bb12-1]MCY1045527.1 PHP domain-containing protein [Corallococcus sp. bb12-1]